MWRNGCFRLSVAVTVGAVLMSGFVLGGDQTTTDRKIVVPSFSVEVVVGPATGAMKIPPAKPPSRPFTALVRVQDSEVEGMWTLPRHIMYAGDSIEEKGSYGPYRITCSVRIDERGETALVEIEYVQMDGDVPTHLERQSFAAHLPRSQVLPG